MAVVRYVGGADAKPAHAEIRPAYFAGWRGVGAPRERLMATSTNVRTRKRHLRNRRKRKDNAETQGIAEEAEIRRWLGDLRV